ncbi:MAG TPA: exopolysaccharide biosynthesis polyprenyl glycosylphosphotransferase [Syntrophorhabdaceae bacterium]
MMNGGEVMKGVEAVPTRRLHKRKLTAITGGLGMETYGHPVYEAVWPEAEQATVHSGIPPVLRFRRPGELLAAGDLFLLTLSAIIAWNESPFPLWVFLVSTLCTYSPWMFVLRLYDQRPDEKIADSIRRVALAALLGMASSCLIVYYSGFYLPVSILGTQSLIICFAISCWRFIYDRYTRSEAAKSSVLIAGAGRRGMVIYHMLKSPHSPLRVEGFLDDNLQAASRSGSPAVMGTCLDVARVAASTGAKQVIVAMSHDRSPESLRTFKNARFNGLIVKEAAEIYEEITGRIPVKFIDDTWFISARGFSLLYNHVLLGMKRLIDTVFSALLGLCLLPVLFFIAAFIKCDSQGPVFYRQARVGKDGKVFTIIKFRSMRQDAEANGARWAEEGDPRVTRIGHYLRKFRIDELPQLWNILKGEMSFIGPRPERPEFVNVLEKEVPHYSVRHTVKPGVTGWAQVILRYGASVDDALDKLEADLYYIKNMSPLLDLKILLRTVGVVILSQGSR